MMRRMATVGLGLVLGLGSILSQAAADDPKPDDKTDSKSDTKSDTKPTPPMTIKAPDFSNYTNVADVVGEVIKSNDKAITLRVTWMVAQPSKSRPRLSANNRNFQNPYSSGRNNHPQLKQEHHDYELEYVPESLVRIKTLPPKFDDNGKKTFYSAKEMDELRQPYTAPGYSASKGDLTPGTIVEVHVIRDKSIPAAKASEDDLRLKYVVILGHDPHPPKDTSPPKKK
ncbi:MAG TPA: hypothetical protein VKE74_14820 [Gemmataceae bacterium]|nr:hypothetical protein [Gemmataceae bacterium]